MATTERRRSAARFACGDLVEEFRERSAALIVAAACKETDDERGGGEGGVSSELCMVRSWKGDADVVGERGRELESEGMVVFAAGCLMLNGEVRIDSHAESSRLLLFMQKCLGRLFSGSTSRSCHFVGFSRPCLSK